MMKEISTLKLGAAMLLIGLFLPLVDTFYFVLPINMMNMIDNFLPLFPFTDYGYTLTVYISVIGFLLLVLHHFKKDRKHGTTYRFLDYALASYMAIEIIAGHFLFFMPFPEDFLAPYIGFLYWLDIFRIVLVIGFVLCWIYGLFRGYGRMAMLFSLCCLVLTYMPFIPYNNAEFIEEQDVFFEQQRSAVSESNITDISEVPAEPDNEESNENAISEVAAAFEYSDEEITVTSNAARCIWMGPGNNTYLLILAYTWLRFGRQFFQQPQSKQEQPESA